MCWEKIKQYAQGILVVAIFLLTGYAWIWMAWGMTWEDYDNSPATNLRTNPRTFVFAEDAADNVHAQVYRHDLR